MKIAILCAMTLFTLGAIQIVQAASVSPGQRKGVACKFEKLGTTVISQVGGKKLSAKCTDWRVTIAANQKAMVHYKVFNEANTTRFKMKGEVENQTFERNRETWRGNPIVFTVQVWGEDAPIIGAVAEALDDKKVKSKPTPAPPPKNKPKPINSPSSADVNLPSNSGTGLNGAWKGVVMCKWVSRPGGGPLNANVNITTSKVTGQMSGPGIPAYGEQLLGQVVNRNGTSIILRRTDHSSYGSSTANTEITLISSNSISFRSRTTGSANGEQFEVLHTGTLTRQ